MTQSAFHLEPERPAKRVQATSLAAYREIAPSLSKRERVVLEGLKRHGAVTAYELFHKLLAEMLVMDLNDVRPRLTALEAKGVIEKDERRHCRITGKTAFTWRLSRAGEEQ